MPQPTHTPTGTFPDLDGTLGDGPLQIQATGEVFSSAILIKSADPAMGLMCKLIDACDWLKKNVTTVTTTAITAAVATVTTRINTITGGAAGASITRQSQGTAVPTSGTWSAALGTGFYTTAATGLSTLAIPLDAEALPHGCTLSSVTLAIDPAAHASIVGLTLPGIFLFETDAAGVSTAIVGTGGLDTSADAAAYSLPHTISITGLATVIDRAKSYVLRFSSEVGGANEAANLNVYGASVTRTAL
jgi:hypothetical protein